MVVDNKLEVNLNRLIYKLEAMAEVTDENDLKSGKNKFSIKSWRFPKFMQSAQMMLDELKSQSASPSNSFVCASSSAIKHNSMNQLHQSIIKFESRIKNLEKIYSAAHTDDIEEKAEILSFLPRSTHPNFSMYRYQFSNPLQSYCDDDDGGDGDHSKPRRFNVKPYPENIKNEIDPLDNHGGGSDINFRQKNRLENQIRSELFHIKASSSSRKNKTNQIANAEEEDSAESVDCIETGRNDSTALQHARIEENEAKNERVASDARKLTAQLKQQLLTAQDLIRRDLTQIDDTTQLVDRNAEQLARAQAALDECLRGSGSGGAIWCNCFVWVVLASSFVIFVFMVLFIRVF